MRNIYEIRTLVKRSEYGDDVLGITLPREVVTMAGGPGTSWHIEFSQISGTKCIVLKSGCSYSEIREQIKKQAKELDLEDLKC